MYGRAAMREYLDGTPGRLMRSLKSLLGSGLMHERTAVGDRSLAFTDILTLYLRMLRERAQREAGAALSSVVLGRPVRFVDDDGGGTRDAQDTLAACARRRDFATSSSSSSPSRRHSTTSAASRARRRCWWWTSAAAPPTSR